MKFRVHGYRFADHLFAEHEEFAAEWGEIASALGAISEEAVISEFESEARKAKSISQALNRLIKRELKARGWADAAAFNHRSDILWNLMKPTLASELNHVKKAIQTRGGVVITATEAMKAAGGFDNAVGTFEDYVQYLSPLSLKLTTPLLIVGLEAPETFSVDVEPVTKGSTTKHGVVRRNAVRKCDRWWCPECGCEVSFGSGTCHCGRRLGFDRP